MEKKTSEDYGTVTLDDILSVSPYSQEWEAHTAEIYYKFTTLSDMISEVAYCITKYTEAGCDNYERLNEDYSWMPEDTESQHQAKCNYRSHQRQLKQELRELKALHSYLKGWV